MTPHDPAEGDECKNTIEFEGFDGGWEETWFCGEVWFIEFLISVFCSREFDRL
jgi:hypothetical protein